MNIIKREIYLERIRPFYDSELIKVLTGMRRSGKSILMKQIIEELIISGINEEYIIYINLENYEYIDLLNDEKLYNFIKLKFISNNKYYIFIDEIQEVRGFERVINSFRSTFNCSIFITGSNAKLLSGELETLLSGRMINFNILPFKFSEFVLFRGETEKSLNELLTEYMTWGGLPLVNKIEENSKIVTLSNIYNTIVLRDIINRLNVKKTSSLEKIIDYLIANSANSISGNNISRELKKNGFDISTERVYEYINAIVNACIIDKVPRYDIRGKKILSFEEKVYVRDLGFYRLKKSRTTDEIGAIIETVVYNELIARGCTVYVGKTYKGEVDFVVEEGEKKYYIQACYLLSDKNVIEREFGAYHNFNDNYPKYVISMDDIKSDREGVIHKNLLDFLLEK